MCDFEDMDIISVYGRNQAVQDGVLVELFKHRWHQLTGGKPMMATAHLFEEVSLAGLLEIWNAYVQWRKRTEPFLPEEERLFSTTMNSKQVWVIEDDSAFTLMYPEDY
jgi:hypothetical protein